MPTEREGCPCWFCSSRRVQRGLVAGLPVQKPITVPSESTWSPYPDPLERFGDMRSVMDAPLRTIDKGFVPIGGKVRQP